MLSSMDSWLAWRSVRLGISTASPVSVLLWMAPFSLRLSAVEHRGQERWGKTQGIRGTEKDVFWLAFQQLTAVNLQP